MGFEKIYNQSKGRSSYAGIGRYSTAGKIQALGPRLYYRFEDFSRLENGVIGGAERQVNQVLRPLNVSTTYRPSRCDEQSQSHVAIPSMGWIRSVRVEN